MQQKPMTPMSRLTNHFRAMESMAPRMNNPTVLQGHSARSGFYCGGYELGRRKGVDNDHVRLYKLSPNLSFGFVFNYIMVEPATVSVTLKGDGGIFESSRNFSADEFRLLMNDFNKLLRSELVDGQARLKESAFEALFVKHFLSGSNNINSVDMEAQVEQITQDCEAIWNEAMAVVDEKQALKKKQQQKTDRLRAKIREEVAMSADGRRLAEVKALIIELEREERDLKKTTVSLTETLSNKYGLPASVDEITRTLAETEQVQHDATAKVENRMASLPTHIKNAIRKKLI